MTISARLKRLEKMLPELTNEGHSRARLLDVLMSTYERVEDSETTSSWLAKQSPNTIFSIAIFGPWPIEASVRERLADIQLTAGPVGKLAKSILEMKL